MSKMNKVENVTEQYQNDDKLFSSVSKSKSRNNAYQTGGDYFDSKIHMGDPNWNNSKLPGEFTIIADKIQ